MVLIGEKLNSSITRIRNIIENRDQTALISICEKQLSPAWGQVCNILDVNTALCENEKDSLKWTIDTIRKAFPNVTISIDSPDSESFGIRERFPGSFLLNSLSLEKLETVEVNPRDEIILRYNEDFDLINEKLSQFRIPSHKVFLDLEAFSLVSFPNQLSILENRAEKVRNAGFRTLIGLSNLSFGLPERKAINLMSLSRVFPALDAIICDTTDENLMMCISFFESISSGRITLFCKNYREEKKKNEFYIKVFPNPSGNQYSIRHETSELTFLGNDRKPDFVRISISFCPNALIVDLKSLKEYFWTFREKIMSYERLINTIYNDLMETLNPKWLRIEMETNIRGGFSSQLSIDSRLLENESHNKKENSASQGTQY